jgi:serine/threonine protein kinase
LIDPLEEEGDWDQVSLAFSGDAGMEILCAVRRLPRHLSEDAESLARFREETALAGRLSHGNLIATHAVGQIDREAFIAEEFVEGHDLSDARARCEAAGFPLPIELGLYVVSQVARGLAYAHDLEGLGLVHSDINPSKIRLSYSGEVKLLGFRHRGSPSSSRGAAAHTRRGDRRIYRAPEASSGTPVDRRADLYSLGVVLWELLAQRRLGAAERPDAPSRANPAIPLALDEIVSKAIGGTPERRFQTADELRAAISAFLPSALNFERSLAELLARTYDIPREREQRRRLVEAGATVRARRSTGQNPLLPPKTNGTRTGNPGNGGGGYAGTAGLAPSAPAPSDRTPLPLVAPLAPDKMPGAGKPPVVLLSRADRYRLRIVASAAFAVLTFVTMVVVIIFLRYAAEHTAIADEPAGAKPRPAPLGTGDVALTRD